MKALKIDVVNKSVTTIQIKDYTEIYAAIGNKCETFCCPIDFPNGDTLYADDESLLNENIEGCFMMPDWNYPIVGNAIILGTDEEGESIDCKTSSMDILSEIIFGNKEVAIEYRDYALSKSPMIISF